MQETSGVSARVGKFATPVPAREPCRSAGSNGLPSGVLAILEVARSASFPRRFPLVEPDRSPLGCDPPAISRLQVFL